MSLRTVFSPAMHLEQKVWPQGVDRGFSRKSRQMAQVGSNSALVGLVAPLELDEEAACWLELEVDDEEPELDDEEPELMVVDE